MANEKEVTPKNSDTMLNALSNLQTLTGEPANTTAKTHTMSDLKTEAKAAAPKRTQSPEDLITAQMVNSARTSILTLSRNSRTSISGKLREYISKKGYIAGYLVEGDEKVDFGLKSIKRKNDLGKVDETATKYMLRLKNDAPSKPRGYVAVVPEKAYSFLSSYLQTDSDSTNFNAKSDEVSKIVEEENPDMVTEIVSEGEINEFFAKNTDGFLCESDAIFSKYIRKSGTKVVKYDTPANCVSKVPGLTNRPGLYRYTSITKGGTAAIRLKHSTRTRLTAPGNYIARKRYQTIDALAPMDEEQAKEYTAEYLNRFLKTSTVKEVVKLSNLIAAQTPYITVQSTGNGAAIVSNDLFTADSNKSILKDMKFTDWYRKDDAGNAVELTLKDKKLVKRIIPEGKSNSRPVYDELKSDANIHDASAYIFDKSSKVVDATKGQLTAEQVIAFFGTPTAPKKPHAKVAKLFGSNLSGITEAQIQKIVAESQKGN